MKKKSIPFYKQVWFPWVSGAIIIPSLGLIWAQANQIWAAPAEIKSVKEAVIQNSNTQATLTKIVQEQKEKNDQQDAELEKQAQISQLQIESLKELVKNIKGIR